MRTGVTGSTIGPEASLLPLRLLVRLGDLIGFTAEWGLPSRMSERLGPLSEVSDPVLALDLDDPTLPEPTPIDRVDPPITPEPAPADRTDAVAL